MARLGRTPIEINWETFDKLCAIMCNKAEIAGYFNCSTDTIENKVKEAHGVTYSEYWRAKSSGGKISLRRKQFQVAMGGNPRMLQWLGINWLDQSQDGPRSADEDPQYIPPPEMTATETLEAANISDIKTDDNIADDIEALEP